MRSNLSVYHVYARTNFSFQYLFTFTFVYTEAGSASMAMAKKKHNFLLLSISMRFRARVFLFFFYYFLADGTERPTLFTCSRYGDKSTLPSCRFFFIEKRKSNT